MNTDVIYTFIVGGYDTLKDPYVVTPGWDYICFTDDETLTSDVWDVRPLPHWSDEHIPEPKRRASMVKIMHRDAVGENYNAVITMDASMTVTCNLDGWLHRIGFGERAWYGPCDFLACEHSYRNCVYKQAQAVLDKGYDKADVVNAQMRRYQDEGYPDNNGQWLSGVTVRRNKSQSVARACQIWAHEYMNGSRRDQLSMNYAFWKSAQCGFPVRSRAIPSVLSAFRRGEHNEGATKELVKR
jgi:hypothetical protein